MAAYQKQNSNAENAFAAVTLFIMMWEVKKSSVISLHDAGAVRY